MIAKPFFLSAVSILLLLGSGKAMDKKLPPWEKPLRVGRYLYLENCSVCHEINKSESKKIGPTLFRVFQNEKLPYSGGEPSEAYIRIKIQFGGDVMPPFMGKLTNAQIDELVAFIRSKK